jgi:hypothetical protein
MGIQPERISDPMNAYTDVEQAQLLARRLEDTAARQLGIQIREARDIIARRIGASPGFLENLRRDPPRIKSVPSWLMGRIRQAFVAELNAEITRLRHELEMASQCGVDPRSDEIMEAATLIEKAKAIIGEVK